jgi:hypothetical protein
VFDQFLHIGLPNSGCSIDIRDFIMDVFRAAGIEFVFNERVIGLCADGKSMSVPITIRLIIKPTPM